jgi:hypothetical protein
MRKKGKCRESDFETHGSNDLKHGMSVSPGEIERHNSVIDGWVLMTMESGGDDDRQREWKSVDVLIHGLVQLSA